MLYDIIIFEGLRNFAATDEARDLIAALGINGVGKCYSGSVSSHEIATNF